MASQRFVVTLKFPSLLYKFLPDLTPACFFQLIFQPCLPSTFCSGHIKLFASVLKDFTVRCHSLYLKTFLIFFSLPIRYSFFKTKFLKRNPSDLLMIKTCFPLRLQIILSSHFSTCHIRLHCCFMALCLPLDVKL